ncbi:MAG: DNA replication licensing factor Mcm4 [Amphiamblys sp. WSBS2006]|nr:MAG: DNA replication licensing factor Mcm4 [Amphiamblys sp. WSBS2006]
MDNENTNEGNARGFQELPASSQRSLKQRETETANSFFGSTTDHSTHENTETGAHNNESAEDAIKVLWGTNIAVEDVIALLKQFLHSFTLPGNETPHYIEAFQQIRQTECYVLEVDCMHLLLSASSESLYRQLVFYPQEIVHLMDHVASEVYQNMFPDEAGRAISVRPKNIERTKNMRNLNPEDIDKLVAIKGLVIRATNIIPAMQTAFFRCSICTTTDTAEITKGKIAHPALCPNKECRARHTMEVVHNRCVFSDKQILRLQETPEIIPDGETPHTVAIAVHGDLVDECRPGDRVVVTGIYRAAPVRVSPRERRVRALFATHIDALHVSIATGIQPHTGGETDAPEEEEEAEQMAKTEGLYEKLAASLAPSIWKMEDVKKGLLLQLFGGVEKRFDTHGGMRFRGDINILLAGDPGVSKSQLLLYVHRMAARGMYASGKGSSSVGLTAYITRDPETGQHVLESGALVLSDGGVCCIDEFDKMSQTTRAVLHEAMEQQTISVAKAGIITTLNARASMLASANPVDSKYNPKKTIVENINLPPTLLSRFDIICLLLDTPREDDDRQLAEHIVSLYTEDGHKAAVAPFAHKKMARYIQHAKLLRPKMDREAKEQIGEGYVAMRKEGRFCKTVSATTRQLESIIRLSEAHAKMRLSETVTASDVQEAVRLLKGAILSYATDPTTGKIDMDIISTGRSRANRDQEELLKKAIVSVLEKKKGKPLSFKDLQATLQAPNSFLVSDKLLVDALTELHDEETISMEQRTASVSSIAVRKV